MSLFVIAIGLPRTAGADEWSRADAGVDAGCAVLFLADWRQTLNHRYAESNPILGSRPSYAAAMGYFVGVTLAQLETARLLPHPWRTIFQGVTIGWESRSVYNN